ncbi:hypothetical protein J1614_005196 [Plenodomus biglobosus]|nr:hypothetical protein J1614_005196 [Plenodomus biglobosus]
MIGAPPSWPWPTERSVLPEPIRRLLSRKSAELDAACTEVERSLLLLIVELQYSSSAVFKRGKIFRQIRQVEKPSEDLGGCSRTMQVSI